MFELLKNTTRTVLSHNTYYAFIKFLCSTTNPDDINTAVLYLNQLITLQNPIYDKLWEIILELYLKRNIVSKATELIRDKFIPLNLVPNFDMCKKLVFLQCQKYDTQSIQKTEDLLHLLSLAKVQIDQKIIQTVYISLSKSDFRNTIDVAERIFSKYVSVSASTNTSIASTHLLNCFLEVFAKSNQFNSAELCENILFSRYESLNIAPDYISFNIVINAWARSRKPYAFEKSLDIIKYAKMQGITLTTVSYTSLLSALSQSKKIDRAEIATSIFNEMIDNNIRPDVQAWSILISIWSKKSYEKAQGLFEMMIQEGFEPNNVTYTTMLNMWGRSNHPDASSRILDIFQKLKNSGKRLDTIGYSSLLSSLKFSNSSDIPQRALEIFHNFLSNGFIPDLQAYTILIGILGKSSSLFYNQECFDMYINIFENGMKPNSITFTSILNFLKNSRHPKARNWLVRVYSDMCVTDKMLDGQSFNSLYEALSVHFTKLKTAEMIDFLITKILNYGVHPDQLVCSITFKAWDRVASNSTYALERAIKLLDMMLSMNLNPSIASYFSISNLRTRCETYPIDENILFYFEKFNKNSQKTFKLKY